MRILKTTLASAAVAGLLAVQPVAAAAQAAPVLDRTGVALDDSEAQAGGLPAVAVVIGGFVVFLVVLELLGAIDVFGDDDSVSP